MYDRYDLDLPWSISSEEPIHPQGDLVTHLVFVGGRLADSWSEEARGSRYAEFAQSLARERYGVVTPQPPEAPAHVQLLEWLDEQAGSRARLLTLDSDPLTDGSTDVPEPDGSHERRRLMAVAELLDGCADQVLRQEEWGHACRRALLLLWETDPQVIVQAPSTAHVAAGIVWAVGKANGWFPSGGYSICTQSTLRDHFGLTTFASGYGKSVQSALRAVLPIASRPWTWRRPDAPDLAPLGRPDLLTATTRRTLIRLRDQALASERLAAGGDFCQAG